MAVSLKRQYKARLFQNNLNGSYRDNVFYGAAVRLALDTR